MHEMKAILTEWVRFLKEEEFVVVPTQKKEEKNINDYTLEDVYKVINDACSLTQNIEFPFALAVAKRESSLNPKAGRGSYRGLFAVGPAALKQVGYTTQEDLKNSIENPSFNAAVAVYYLQYLFNRISHDNIYEKYQNKIELDSYTLTYIAYNLGYGSMLDIAASVANKKNPSKATVKYILAQSPRFRGKNDYQTMLNYFNEVNGVFGNL